MRALSTTGLIVALATAGCGGDDPDPIDRNTGGLCAGETRAEPYSPGLQKETATGIRVRLEEVEVEGVPDEPDRGLNTWRLVLLDGAGNFVEQADVELRPWMPDHGHGTSPNEFEATPMDGSPGTYEVGPFDLFMGGFWTFDVRVNGTEPEDRVQFAFCLEG